MTGDDGAVESLLEAAKGLDVEGAGEGAGEITDSAAAADEPSAQTPRRGKGRRKVTASSAVTAVGSDDGLHAERLPRPGHISYGGHGKEWEEKKWSERMGNNKKLRSERETAALQKKLQDRENRRGILSGKAKKALQQERRAAKREKKRSESDK